MAKDIPVYQRQEKPEVGTTPDFGSVFREAGAAQNNLSAIGARVAQSASNEMAAKLGYESGKNPTGDLSPSLTEFDKNFANSYHAQAHATLSIQGEKLLNDADIELSKTNRLTPALIESSNKQVKSGLDKIASNAPTAVRGALQQSFDSMYLRQNNQYQTKMLSQQREDQKNTIADALSLSAKNAYELASNGDYKGAENAAIQAKGLAENAVSNRYLTPEQARTAHETAKQAFLNGKYTHMAIDARNNGKLEEFYKQYASEKPEGMTNEQWYDTGSAVEKHVAFLDTLKRQDENLRLAKFSTAIAQNVNAITGDDIAELKANTTPLEFEKAHLDYIQGIKTFEKSTKDISELINGFSDPETFARATSENKNKAFDQLVNAHVQQMQQAGTPISKDEAEVQVATMAPGAVPGYTQVLKAKLASTNPVDIESAGASIEHIMRAGRGQNLDGLDSKDLAMIKTYNALKNSMIPIEAAQAAHDTVYSTDTVKQEAINQKWAALVKSKTGVASPTYQFGLQLAGIKEKNIRNADTYGLMMLDTYKAYFVATGGDANLAKEMLQENVKNVYGTTRVNGEEEFTYVPIEKAINLPEDSAGVIQQDVYEHLDNEFKSSKQLYYDAGKSDTYWEVKPRATTEHVLNKKEKVLSKLSEEFGNKSILRVNAGAHEIHAFNKGEPVEVIKHYRGRKSETYQVALQPTASLMMTNNPTMPIAGGWDIALKTPHGIRPIYRDDPSSGVLSYRPNVEKIKKNYLALHPLNNGA